MTRSLACTGPLVALVLFASTVAAQPSSPAAPPPPARAPATMPKAPPLSDALQGAAKTAYESAKLLATNLDFAGALTEFGHAYALSNDPRLLFNMAICRKELHHYARMRTLLEQYLRDGASVTTADSQAAAQDALKAIKPLVAALQIKVDEDGAEVRVDGEVVGNAPLEASVPVDLGKHVVDVKKAGFDPFEQTLETLGGTEAVVDVKLVAQRHVARLVVVAEPDATVVVDRKGVAQGRFDGSVPAGSHDISVVATGKKTYQAQVELRDGETRTMDVTLEDQAHGGSPWPWIVGGAVVAAGAAIGGYFLLKPQDQTTAQLPAGRFGSVQFDVWRP